MPKKTQNTNGRFWRGHVLALGALCMLCSFTVGIQSAGDMHTIVASEAAGEDVVPGDMNGDGRITLDDPISILRLLRDGEAPTERQLLADPSGDARLTVDDAILLLRDAR